MEEMKTKIEQSPANHIDHYKIEMDAFQGGGKASGNVFRSIYNPQDWLMLKGKEFFDKEKLNPYQQEVKKKL